MAPTTGPGGEPLSPRPATPDCLSPAPQAPKFVSAAPDPGSPKHLQPKPTPKLAPPTLVSA